MLDLSLWCPIIVVIMYVDISQSGEYRRVLLRESYRENGRVRKRTVANLSHVPEEVVLTLQIALRNIDKIPLAMAALENNHDSLSHGKSVGAAFAAASVARRVGITAALGRGRKGLCKNNGQFCAPRSRRQSRRKEGEYAPVFNRFFDADWRCEIKQKATVIFAQVLSPTRPLANYLPPHRPRPLSAVRLHQTHALAEAVDLKKGFCEDDLYQNLAWLADNQDKIENRLFKFRGKKQPAKQTVNLFLYDVTSSKALGRI